MDASWLPLLRCPHTGEGYDADVTRREGDEIVEAFLVGRETRRLRLVLAGIGVLPADLTAHLRTFGHVYRRTPMADARIVRFVIGRTWRGEDDFVPFEEVVARYGDLMDPAHVEAPPPPDPGDAALAAILDARTPGQGRGLDVGCGVGRGVFVLAERLGHALGLDRSAARIRRARNIAATEAHFFVPPPPDLAAKEVPLELDRLARRGAAFAVAAPEALPLAEAAFDVVVLRAGDGVGPWADPARALAAATAAVAPGGRLVLEAGAVADGPAGWSREGEAGSFTAWGRP